MKTPLTVRLARHHLVALRSLARQRDASLSSVVEQALAAYLESNDQALPLVTAVDQLRSQMAQQAEAHSTAMQEQRELFRATQKGNSQQMTMVLDMVSNCMQATLQPLIDAMGGAQDSPPIPVSTAPTELVLGQKRAPSSSTATR